MKVIETKTEFDELIKNEKAKLIVIDFYAEWCGPCKNIAPKLLEFEKEYPDVLFCKVDVDKCDEIAAECAIKAMPTFQFYKAGKKVHEFTGASAEKIKKLIEEHMK